MNYVPPNETRVFFVTECKETNPEIFETLDEAKNSISIKNFKDYPRLYIAIVKNAYREENGEWNYNDLSDTFQLVAFL